MNIIEPNQSVSFEFSLCNSTGAAANATGTPVVAIAVNGVEGATSVTVTNPATGVYKCALTAGAWSALDAIQARVSFVMDGVSSHAIVWVATVGPVRVDLQTIDGQDVTATASFSFDNLTTLIGKLSGITTLKNWLAAMMGKAADAPTLAEINATTAGATYTNSTDSQEAMRDNVGTAGAGLNAVPLNATLATGAFTAAVLANAPTGSTITYSVSTTTVGAAPTVNITLYRYARIGPLTITAETSQTGDSHALLVYAPGSSTVLWSLTTANSEISVGGDGVTLTITDTDAHTGTPGQYAYVLRNTTDDTVVCDGSITIEDVPNVT